MTDRPLLEAQGLRRRYRARGLTGRGDPVQALDGVDLAVDAGESVAILGTSGAGKSTLARVLLALEKPDAGWVRFDGHEISGMSEAAIRPLRRRFQPVFQDSLAAFDPRVRVAASIAEPLAAPGIGTVQERRRRVGAVIELVGLSRSVAARYPGSLSGGERQRAAIARALAPEPELLILDEPVSSLDGPVALAILDLLSELRGRLGLALVLITHDVGAARAVCDRVVVMEAGRCVEEGPTVEVLRAPGHPATRALVDATPTLDLEL
jgi:ABC-type glutathione transport system ATPase component